jgi:hypothetical protein
MRCVNVANDCVQNGRTTRSSHKGRAKERRRGPGGDTDSGAFGGYSEGREVWRVQQSAQNPSRASRGETYVQEREKWRSMKTPRGLRRGVSASQFRVVKAAPGSNGTVKNATLLGFNFSFSPESPTNLTNVKCRSPHIISYTASMSSKYNISPITPYSCYKKSVRRPPGLRA